MQLAKLIKTLNQIAPPQYACSWDKIGLQVGNKKQEIKKVLLTLDCNTAAIKKAIKLKADLIISHHPLIFKDINKLDLQTPLGKNIQDLIQNNIALFVMHTNLDAAPDGVNHTLAQAEGLNPNNCEVIEPTYTERLCKYSVFVPTEAVDKVHQAIAEAGGGHIGNYSDCTFRTSGQGTYKPLAGAKPYLGQVNKLEIAAEQKIETIIREDLVGNLINQVRQAHPYEEIAYDIYPLNNKGRTYGLGLVGKLNKEITIAGKKIKRLAVCSGSGGSLINKAVEKGAEAFILGEAGYHDQLLAEELGLPLVIKGHYETEITILPVLQKKLSAAYPELTISCQN